TPTPRRCQQAAVTRSRRRSASRSSGHRCRWTRVECSRDRARLRLLRGRGGGLLPLVTLLPVLPDLHALAAVLAPAAGHPMLLLLWLRSAAPSRTGGSASSVPRAQGDACASARGRASVEGQSPKPRGAPAEPPAPGGGSRSGAAAPRVHAHVRGGAPALRLSPPNPGG